MNITFVARLVDQNGRVIIGEFEAPMDHKAAWTAAEKAFPDCTVETIYPEKQPYRLEWTWANQS
jgi:hypothetical protein